ncbi:LptA/OstA family protein [Sporomusa termitida]|uniref:Lipopolysaccharide export system protein LptA n=1 Tax=Sporomusa termitida TaxID=2377 RepID=A0A517DXI1_9FIRM|nr:LptA/OstA family protein [Sporomusa termitida]QDR82058.1 Lipopolysaccharide export system protein LptA [Sporomusa termitida]
MINIKRISWPAAVAMLLALLVSTGSLMALAAAPAANTPVEIAAESIEYDAASGLMTATGGVRITQGQAVMTGDRAQYNTKSQEGHLTGGVQAVSQDATLTAAEVKTYNNNTRLVAWGGAVLTKGEQRLTGPRIEYITTTQYALVPENAKIEMPDGTMTANKIEAFIPENRATGTGSVHIVSPARKLDAIADTATYYGEPQGQSKVVLSGNARAVQDGNILTGETLTLHLDEKAMGAQGRTKLVITPQ